MMAALAQGPLPDLLGRLLREPLVLVLLITWIVGGIGKVLQSKKKREEAIRSRGGRSEAFDAEPRRRTPEEVAAEMRRVLGMEPAQAAAKPVKRYVTPPRVPIRTSLRRPDQEARRFDAQEGDRGTQPMRVSELGKVDIHVDPHVGEGMQRRAAPTSGGVAAHELGTLGGRQHGHSGRGASADRRLFDLQDLSRAIVLREVLDEPRAVRGWDR